jgi:ABC-type transport system substrate-binding protein
LAIVVVAAACGGGDDEGSGEAQSPVTDAGGGPQTTVALTPEPGGKLIYALQAESDGWTPAANRWTTGGLNVARAVYDPLAAFDVDGVARPYLAESIEPNDDFTEWTITLRDGVIFHNGDPLTAEIVAQNLQAVKESALIGPTFKLIESVEASGPLEVTITMAESWSSFPVLLAQQPGFIVHPSMLSGERTDPLGTGPFSFVEWVPDDHLSTERFPDYWRADADGNALPYLNEVEFRVITEPLSRQQALEAADVDVIQTNDPQTLIGLGPEREAPNGGQVIYSEGSEDEQLIALNAQAGALDDPYLRLALAKATDRELLNNELYEGFFELAETPYPEDSPWYTDPGWPEYDPEAATELVQRVADAGGDTTVTLSAVTTAGGVAEAQAIAEQWEAVGVTVEIESLDAPSLTLQIVTGEYEAAIFSLFNSPDPDGDYHFWDPTNITDPGQFSLAFTRYQNDDLKAAMDAARKTTDPAARAEQYAIVWREIAENVPVIWLWHTQQVVITRQGVHGMDTFTLPDGEPAHIVNWGSTFLTTTWVEG